MRDKLDLPERVRFHDVTLRDGEQTPGVTFRAEEKIRIAGLLDEAGVDRIEVAMPAVSDDDVRAVKGVVELGLKADILVFSRARKDDIDLACECGVDGIILEFPFGEPRMKHQFAKWSEDDVIDAITASSRSTVCMGNAVIAACEDVKRKLVALATERRSGSGEIRVAAGRVAVGGEIRTYADVIAASYGQGEGQVVGVGEFRLPRDPTHPLGGKAAFWEIIFVATEVEVDAETGQYAVTKLATVADVGRAINPAQVEGQDEGGALMSVGQAMMEHLILDARGIPRNLGALDYRIPTAMDVPAEVRSLLIENADGPGPFGAKGVGESGAIAVTPAIGGAVSAAIGRTFAELPITAERVWEALRGPA